MTSHIYRIHFQFPVPFVSGTGDVSAIVLGLVCTRYMSEQAIYVRSVQYGLVRVKQQTALVLHRWISSCYIAENNDINLIR